MIFIVIILNKSMEKKYNYYSQTDSLTYEIKTEDFEMTKVNLINNSDYPKYFN